MKTVSQLGSGKKPVGTTAYMGRVEQLMQSRCDVQRGNTLFMPLVRVFVLAYIGNLYPFNGLQLRIG
jgi:hypothetical protein